MATFEVGKLVKSKQTDLIIRVTRNKNNYFEGVIVSTFAVHNIGKFVSRAKVDFEKYNGEVLAQLMKNFNRITKI